VHRNNRAAALADSDAGEANAILQLLTSADKLHVDSLIDGSGMTASAVLKLLLELELRGVVTQHPGKLFSLANEAGEPADAFAQAPNEDCTPGIGSPARSCVTG
jgi:DprA winged helix domain